MLYCETCRWADDNNQPPGTAICRIKAPSAGMVAGPNGQVATLGMFPPVRLAFDWCGEHDDSEPRRRIHIASNMPGPN